MSTDEASHPKAPTHARSIGVLGLVVRLIASIGVGLAAASSCTPAQSPTAHVPSDAAREAEVDASADGDADSDSDADSDADADSGPDAARLASAPFAAQGRCPEGMAALGPSLCIDRWEAALVTVAHDGTITKNPPNHTPEDTDDIRAVSAPGHLPQTYVSALQAEDACQASSKRLCSHAEWISACEGQKKLAYPYGERRTAGTCNDDGRSPIGVVFPGSLGKMALVPPRGGSPVPGAGAAAPTRGKKGKAAKGKKTSAPTKKNASKKGRRRTSGPAPGVDPAVWTKLNDPRLGEVSGTFTKTGERALCKNDLDVFDLVGNAHEWVSDELANGNGVFAGGYFQDVQINGEGCHYRTTAHARSYRDYSVGFRCCKDLPEP